MVSVETRFNTLEALEKLFKDKISNVEKVEQSLFTRDKHDVKQYLDNAKRIAYNLLVNSDRDLSNINEEFVAFLSDEQLCSSEVKALEALEKKKHDDTMKMLERRVEEVVSIDEKDAAVVCKRCKSNKLTIQQKQTRSADEGATVFFTCKECSFSWKEN